MDPLSVPFLTRKMLSFSGMTSFRLHITSQALAAGDLIIRGMTKDGTFTLRHTVDSSGAVAESFYDLPDIPIFVSINDPDFSFVQGNCYVTLTLQSNKDDLYTLCSGMVYGIKSLSWPQPTADDLRPGGGNLQLLTSADPAAGAEISHTGNTHIVNRLIAVDFTLVTSGTVANRQVMLQLQALGGNFKFPSLVVQPASQTYHYTFAAGAPSMSSVSGGEVVTGIGQDIFISGGDPIATVTTLLKVDDDFSAANILVETFMYGT